MNVLTKKKYFNPIDMTATAKELKEKLINSAFAAESGLNYPEGSMGWEIKQAKIRLLDKFCEALCRDFNGFMIDKYAEDPTQIPMIDDVIDEFLKDNL